MRIELWGYDRRNPFLPSTTDGALALLGLIDRRAPLYWGMLDRLEQWKLRQNPWRSSGIKTPGAPVGVADPGLPIVADAD